MDAYDMLTVGPDGVPRALTPDEILARKAREAAMPGVKPLGKEEANTLLGNLAQSGLGALTYVGQTLDKTFGGRSVRGLLAGKPRELLAPVPFSDTLGITNPEDVTHGRDLLESAGVLQKKPEGAGFQWDDLAGMGADVALDPATYMTFGALKPAGRLLEKAGALPATTLQRLKGLTPGTGVAKVAATAAGVPEAEIAGKPLAGLVGFGLPFAEPAFSVGSGAAGQGVARAMERLYDTAAYSRVGRSLSQLFDYSTGGLPTEAAQRGMRASQPARAAGHAAALQDYMNIARVLDEHGLMDAASGKMIRAMLEGTHQGPYMNPAAQAAVDAIRTRYGAAITEGSDVGRKISALTDPEISYASRQVTPPARDAPGFFGGRRKPTDALAGQQAARREVLTEVPGGTETVNQFQKDKALRAMIEAGQDMPAAETLRRNYLGMPLTEEQFYLARRNETAAARQYIDLPPGTAAHPGAPAGMMPNPDWTPEFLPGVPTSGPGAVRNPEWVRLQRLGRMYEKSHGLVDLIRNTDPFYAAEQADYFGNHPLTDFASYLINHNRAQVGATTVHDILARAALPAGHALGPGEEAVSAMKALQGANLDYQVLAGGGASRGGPDALLARLKELDPAGYSGASVNDLANVMIPKDVVQDVTKGVQALGVPEAMQPLVEHWDAITNLTKAFQTSPFPGFHARNLVSGAWQNLVSGAINPLDPIRGYLDAAAIRNGQVIAGAARRYFPGVAGLDDVAASKKIAEEMFVNSARTGLSSSAIGETIGKGAADLPLMPSLPGTNEKSIARTLVPWLRDSTGATAWNDITGMGVRGVYGARETTHPYLRYMEEAGHLGDDLNRMSGFLGLRAQGYNPATAALKSKAAHYDYSRLTDFEREAMRRVIPFYNWTRQNVPFQLAELASRPGGITAQAMRLPERLNSADAFVPPSVSQGLAIPVGAEAEGQQRYLTALGLPAEDAFNWLGTAPTLYGSAARTTERLAGMLNPILKLPIELAAGKQMFSGRELDDLYSRTGLGVVPDQLIMNSPAGRAVTTLGQLTDERKDLLTKAMLAAGPFKVSDVDTQKARAAVGKQVIGQSLDEVPAVSTYERLYVPPEKLGMLSPQEMRMYQLYQFLQKEARAAAERKKGPVR